MREILPRVFDWTSFHEGIQDKVHSHYVSAVEPAVLIDPRLPKEGLRWFEGRPEPRHIYLTNRHHYRHSRDFAEAFGSTVWCHEKGLHEFTHGETVKSFKHGRTLPGGVVALRIGSLCDEETGFYLPILGGILALGDSVIRTRRGLSFVPDEYMGDDPDEVKRGLIEALRKHLRQRPVAHLLLAHGTPVLNEAHRELNRFVEAWLHRPRHPLYRHHRGADWTPDAAHP